MSEARCGTCGTPLIPGTGFCRQCGAPTAPELEQPTAILGQAAEGTTKRLDPRPTNPYRETSGADELAHQLSEVADVPGARPRKLLFVGILVVAVLACVSIVGVVRSVLKPQPVTQSVRVNRSLMYPNSKVILDMGDSGGGVLQMSTSDPLQTVQAWYVQQMKPDKILQATLNSAIMRKDNVSATLLSENNTTTIIIKQSSR
jgi:hypothetical protein